MCGIVGLLLKKPALRSQLGELMVPMLIGMTERGPDSAGLAVFTDPLASGQRKISVYSGLTDEGVQYNWPALLDALNTELKVQAKASAATAAVGIDLGLKEAAVTSTGERIEGRFYRKLECKLGIAQRAHKKHRVKAIHAKIANQRKDLLHQFSTALVKQNAAIFVGDVSSAKLVKTKMAKSTLDAGWSMLKTMLEYKSHQAGIVFEVVNENYTTQTCSCCGVIPASSPKGRAGLRIREWTCSECGAVHDRDVNAATNLKNMAVSSTVSACGEEGAGRRRKTAVKPASVKQEASSRFSQK